VAVLISSIAASVLAQTATAGANPPIDPPAANPGRPTVSTPATLTPVGYFQFESGILAAWNSPGVSSQQNLNEVIKCSVSRWIELPRGIECTLRVLQSLYRALSRAPQEDPCLLLTKTYMEVGKPTTESGRHAVRHKKG
jgi:hypothetical protein